MTSDSDYLGFSSSIILGPHKKLFDYWLSIFPTKGIPGRRHFDPIDVPGLLSMIFLVDVLRDDAPMRFRFRLLGTAITERAGRDMTGRWLDEVYPDGQAFESVARIYSAIATSGQPHVGQYNILAPGREYVRANRIILPLAQDGTTVDMLLGMWVYDNEASKPPEEALIF